MMNTPITPEEEQAAERDLAAVASWAYTNAGISLHEATGQAHLVSDVWMLVDIDNGRMHVNAAGEHTQQRLEPGSYLILQLVSPAMKRPVPGLYAFPVEGV